MFCILVVAALVEEVVLVFVFSLFLRSINFEERKRKRDNGIL